jgi:hypothetical protein
MDFSYVHASSANLEALYHIELVLKPLVSAVARQQGCWRLIDAAD